MTAGNRLAYGNMEKERGSKTNEGVALCTSWVRSSWADGACRVDDVVRRRCFVDVLYGWTGDCSEQAEVG